MSPKVTNVSCGLYSCAPTIHISFCWFSHKDYRDVTLLHPNGMLQCASLCFGGCLLFHTLCKLQLVFVLDPYHLKSCLGFSLELIELVLQFLSQRLEMELLKDYHLVGKHPQEKFKLFQFSVLSSLKKWSKCCLINPLSWSSSAIIRKESKLSWSIFASP